ncbi:MULTISPECIES: hypothetical protein [Peribacillus]|uniref:hypothetical protein n=1 Tax=Peribacillus TaxID=2675229 RepID=UPI0010711DDD|nr:hypothetical protein [Peribacillus frigoritolerans]MEC0344328.1 hypothetical protein [Peribacillus castrilensis]TFH63208.1 hypothetical protein E4J71_05475 [Peribacillus frigoritolerans]
MQFSKDELGGETEKDGSENAQNTGFTQNITAMEMQEFGSKSFDGKNENTYIHCNLGKFQSWSDGCSHALEIHHESLRYLILKRSSMYS